MTGRKCRLRVSRRGWRAAPRAMGTGAAWPPCDVTRTSIQMKTLLRMTPAPCPGDSTCPRILVGAEPRTPDSAVARRMGSGSGPGPAVLCQELLRPLKTEGLHACVVTGVRGGHAHGHTGPSRRARSQLSPNNPPPARPGSRPRPPPTGVSAGTLGWQDPGWT